MLQENYQPNRALRSTAVSGDLAIVGGGMSGVCAAITAARAGTKVVLLQDRPVLGGNASSEVRLWILGATSHMGNNNRWAREGGVIDEILVENTYRNKEGNPVILDTIILDKVLKEPNITLLLNTCVYAVEKNGATLSAVHAFCSQNHTFYTVQAPLFCDASGDGIVAYLAGAGYRMGAEEKEEWQESFAPGADYGELLGHTISFYSKDAGKPVAYTAPDFALKDITEIPRSRQINAGEHGCKYWWLEYGGRLDTIHDTEKIKWELWRVVYGVWDHIKNSGQFEGVENLTLEWVGIIPGKRESRRFNGHYWLTQQDIVGQKAFDDAVAFGGWAIDLHPADGVFSEKSGCSQYHAKGVYEIPLRCFISKDITNLLYAGRIISASHVAHGSSRVMATAAFGAQAAGMAAVHCLENGLAPADLLSPDQVKRIQERLNIAGQSIPRLPIAAAGNLLASATVSASSHLLLHTIPFDGDWLDLTFSAAQMLPMTAGTAYALDVCVDAARKTFLQVELRYADKPCNHTPEKVAERIELELEPGRRELHIAFRQGVPANQYGFVTFLKNEDVRIQTSTHRYTGILSVFNKFNLAVNNHGKQVPPAGSGFDAFEFWCPERRPAGANIAMRISPAIGVFGADQLNEGFTRPTILPNAWVAAPDDPKPTLAIYWGEPVTFRTITLYLDTDFDHPMESVQMGHAEAVMPFCVRTYTLLTDTGKVLYRMEGNYQTINRIVLDAPETATGLRLVAEHPSERVPAALFHLHIDPL